jgi:hypothetical protein
MRSDGTDHHALRSFGVAALAIAVLPLTASLQEGVVASRAERQVVAAEQDWALAKRQGNREHFARLLAPDFIEIKGSVLLPSSVQPPVKAVVDDDFGVRVHGNLGLVIGDVLRASVSNDATDRFRYSSVWIREQGQWHVVAEQRTPIS